MLLRFYIKDALASPGSILLQAMLLVLTTAFAVVFVLAWPSYLAEKELTTHTVNWNLKIDGLIDETMKSQLEQIMEDYSEITDVSALHTGFAILEINGKPYSGPERRDIEAQLLYPNSYDLYPIDVFTAPVALVKGNPYGEEGSIIAGNLAQTYGLSVGDVVTVQLGLWFSEEIQAYHTFDFTVEAIVAPDDVFYNTVAMFVPQGVLEWMSEVDGRVYTDLYCFDGSQERIRELADNLNEAIDNHPVILHDEEGGISVNPQRWDVQVLLGDDERARHMDYYLQDKGVDKFTLVSCIVAAVMLLSASLAAGLLKLQRRKGSYAIFESFGVSARRLAVSSFGEALISYLLLGTTSFFLGRFFSQVCYGLWIPPWLDASVFLGVIGAYLLAAMIQAVVIVRSFRPEVLHRVLVEEREP